jgi:pimeloyl-ACP methyl ester carboxylesterase
MHVSVNGTRIFFDVSGEKLVPEGKRMRERPTLLLLHGGPGGDHSTFRPLFAQLADVAQVIYLDHRGNGRSDWGEPASWNLPQWGDDIRGFCDVLGIEKPIVLGYSFGGMVAQSYATRHPDHPGKMVFYSTSPKRDREETYAIFERLGGPEARAVAEARWTNPNPETSAAYLRVCSPLYNPRGKRDPEAVARTVRNEQVSFQFAKSDDGPHPMDFRAALANIKCPSLVIGGEDDPITPISRSELLAACIPQHLVRLVRVPNAGHGVHNDDPALAMRLLREFILAT